MNKKGVTMKVVLILLCLMAPLCFCTDSFCASPDRLSEAQIQKGIDRILIRHCLRLISSQCLRWQWRLVAYLL